MTKNTQTQNSPKLSVRHSRAADSKAFSELELVRYARKYQERPRTKAEIENMFRRRYANAGKWMWTLEIDGKPEGFITGQPTSKLPQDFISWEEATNNGTLDGTIDEHGENMYVVNLDVSSLGTSCGGQYLLMAHLGARAIKEGKNAALFESRIPQFRDWVREYAPKKGMKINNLSVEQLDKLATRYSKVRIRHGDKLVPHDRLLRFYHKSGFTFVKTVRNAFDDPESMNYGVICLGRNPLPRALRYKPINYIVAYIFRSMARRPALFRLFVK